eukprot:scaffold8722_cov105-Skeletonema_dohrnii-CCMP3373.AAC.4
MLLGQIVRQAGFNSTREAGGSVLILLPFTWAQSHLVLIPIVPHLITPTLSPPLNPLPSQTLSTTTSDQ